MKNQSTIVCSLVVLVLLSSCVPLQIEEELISEKAFIQFAGIAEMLQDEAIQLGDLNHQDLAVHIDLSWEIGERMTFSSDELMLLVISKP